MEEAVQAELLGRRWLHSHEEDTETERVYRPAGYDFPPSRGRSGFELLSDGGMVDVGIAPADGPVEATGRWRLENDHLILESGGQEAPATRLKIVVVDEERLIVARLR